MDETESMFREALYNIDEKTGGKGGGGKEDIRGMEITAMVVLMSTDHSTIINY